MVSPLSNCGSVTSNGNLNTEFTGTNNSGILQSNANLILHAISSKLHIVENQNCKFTIVDCTLKCTNVSNTKIKGNQNKFSLDDNQNIQIQGELNEVTFEKNTNTKFDGKQNKGKVESNSNFDYSGNSGKFSFRENSNTKISGNNNVINGDNNSNLKVEGDDHQLNIKGTTNHSLKTALKNSSDNSMCIKPNSFQSNSVASISSWTSWLGGTHTTNDVSVHYSIDYVTKATIQNDDYNLGIFQFKMLKKGNQVEVIVDNSNLDAGSYVITNSRSEKITIAGTKDGIKQRLNIIGPAVNSQGIGDATVFHVKLLDSSENL